MSMSCKRDWTMRWNKSNIWNNNCNENMSLCSKFQLLCFQASRNCNKINTTWKRKNMKIGIVTAVSGYLLTAHPMEITFRWSAFLPRAKSISPANESSWRSSDTPVMINRRQARTLSLSTINAWRQGSGIILFLPRCLTSFPAPIKLVEDSWFHG